ncbi:MAG TPA: PEP-CTERM sorting domain-containing protein [Isosphaeraceae bacterium]|nr:PEP-CTERM sorting domain-containing protein [Isosphaeraceae bacterium]
MVARGEWMLISSPSGQYHALLLTPNDPNASIPSVPPSPGNPAPVPEPSTLIFLGLVLTGAGTRRLIRQAARRRAGR